MQSGWFFCAFCMSTASLFRGAPQAQVTRPRAISALQASSRVRMELQFARYAVVTDDQRQFLVQDCQQGYFSSAQNSTTCVKCGAGTISTGGVSQCTACIPGLFCVSMRFICDNFAVTGK